MNLIDELRAIQDQHGYLPENELRAFSQQTHIPLYQLQAVASFYPHFRLSPGPKLEVKICADLSCHLAGARQLHHTVQQQQTRWSQCNVSTVSCLGRCDRAPAVAINDTIYAEVNEPRVHDLLTAFASGTPPPNSFVQHGSSTAQIDPYPHASDRFTTLRQLLHGGNPTAVIQILKVSGLGGMVGAGFPTGMKWEIVRNATGEPKYVVVNADESEPGTFKDRFLMEHFPYLLIEGILLGAYIVGAHKAYIFIRHEYPDQEHTLATALTAARAQGLMGERILGSDFSCDI